MTATRKGMIAAGLLFFAAPVGWIGLQQGVGATSYFACHASGVPWGALAGVGVVAFCALATYLCWKAGLKGSETRRFLMSVGAGAAVIFTLAALVMTTAIILVPACAR